jgi:hypothetical protein
MVPAPVWWYKIIRQIFEKRGRWPRDFEQPFSLNDLISLCQKNRIKICYGIYSPGFTRSSAILGIKMNDQSL